MDNNTENMEFLRAYLPILGFTYEESPWTDTYLMQDPYVCVIIRGGKVFVGRRGSVSTVHAVRVAALVSSPEEFARIIKLGIEEVINDARRKSEGGGKEAAG